MEKAPEHGGRLTGTWEMMSKGPDGEPVVTTLHKYEHEDDPSDRLFLSQAAPTKITSARTLPIKRDDKLCADIPDIHYGFRKLPDGSLRPTHSPEVLDVWLQIMKDEQPNLIVIGGDLMDWSEISRFDKDSNHFVATIQLCIDGLYRYLSRVRADNPKAEIIALGGNHEEKRMRMFMSKHAFELLGIKRADVPEEYPVMTLPYLLRLGDLAIKWVSGYPAGHYKINDRLITMHGDLANKNSTAAVYLQRYATSVMYHHDHRRGYEKRVFPDGKAIEAFGFGCQADITGSVPSVHNGIDDQGQVVERYENWNNGGGFVHYLDGDKPFQIEAVPIEPQDGYLAIYHGKEYKPREEVVKQLAKGE